MAFGYRLDATDREIGRIAIPAMGALAADPLLSLVDTALVGALGRVPLAALGINLAVFTTLFVVFNFLTYGTTAEVARHRGADDELGAVTYALQALWMALALGVALLLLLQTTAPWIARAMGATGEVRDPTLVYLRIRALSAVPFMIVMVGHGVFRGLKDTTTPLKIALWANGVNIVLSYVLIHPFGLGIAGAAWGTVIAQLGAAAVFLRQGSTALGSPVFRFDPIAMRRMIRVSRDLFLRTLSLLSATLITTAIAARMGITVVAGHQVVREVWTLLALTLDGFAIAGQAMVGTALGARRADLAYQQTKRLLGWGVATGIVLAPIVLLLGGIAPRLFTRDVGVLAEIGQVWWFMAALLPIGGLVFIADGILMGMGDLRFLLWSTALASLGTLVPICLVALWLDGGIVGLWIGMAGLMIVRGATCAWRLSPPGWERALAQTAI